MDTENMSPEQIAELQKQNCIFCHIVNGKVSSKKIYEDDRCIGILDINPANPGHVLLIPKEHYTLMALMPEDIVEHMAMVSRGISKAALRALKVQGTNIFMANGAVAGQKAPHFMMHIIPRKDNDSLATFNIPEKRLDDAELEKLRISIRERLVNLIPDMPEEEQTSAPEPEKEPEPEPATQPEPATTPRPEASPDLDQISNFLIQNPQLLKKEEPFTEQEEERTEGKYVGSYMSTKFHIPQCPLAKKIKPENRIWFETLEAAERRHERCDCLK